MNIEKYDSSLQTVRQRIKNLSLKEGNNIHFSACFIKEGIKDYILNKLPVSKLSLIRKNLMIEKPDIVRIELFEDENSKKVLWMHNIDLSDERRKNQPEKESFKGFGEAEVNQIVQSRLGELMRQNEFEDLKRLNQEYEQEVLDLEQKLETAENRIGELEQSLETKNGIKYYAGLLGDILEGFGIKKEKIRQPLANLMGMDEAEEIKTKASEDTSGIVREEQNSNQQKRNELVELISQYLHSCNDTLLSKIFEIFSEIESHPEQADKIRNYLQTTKTE